MHNEMSLQNERFLNM